jgi:hypothetical protein
MSNYVKLAASAGDQFLSAMAQNQESFLKAVSAYSTAVASSAPAVSAPAFAEFPTPQEISEANFAFATKLLKQQKEFSEKLLETFTPHAAS